MLNDKKIGCLVGLAVGDAVGTSVEFKPRGSFPPVTDMTGGGPFSLPVGYWTDDTSMALCLANSLIEHGFDPLDQMKKYTDWFQNGYMSSTGTCFDIGHTTVSAISEFMETNKPFCGDPSPYSSGNGGLMRLAPIAIKYHNSIHLEHYASESTRTTHGSIECLESSKLFSKLVSRAINGDDVRTNFKVDIIYVSDKVNNIAKGKYYSRTYDQLSGSGYVIDSLETALWCFLHTDNFRDAILMCVNVGDDTDTTAAICGQIAGAYYGLSGIPKEWLDKLYNLDYIFKVGSML